MPVFARSLLALLVVLSSACSNDARQARSMLDQANDLLEQRKTEDARQLLNRIVADYGGGQEAAEATRLLSTLDGSAKGGERSEESLRHELLVQVGRFALDCGRYPTLREGFTVLLTNPGIDGWKGPYLDKSWANRIDRFEYKMAGDRPEIGVRH